MAPGLGEGCGSGWTSRPVWLSEHYWPDLATELVLSQGQHLAGADGVLSALVVPGQHSAFGLWDVASEADLRRFLARAGVGAGALSQGWLISRSTGDPRAGEGGVVRPTH